MEQEKASHDFDCSVNQPISQSTQLQRHFTQLEGESSKKDAIFGTYGIGQCAADYIQEYEQLLAACLDMMPAVMPASTLVYQAMRNS